MSVLLAVVWLTVGLILILVGANWLTDGSSAIARRLGVSDLVIGLTVVAFGTSAPELAISIISALDGNTSLAVGNVVGSNIFNILMIIGVTACIRPIKVERSVMTEEIPMVVLAALVMLLFGLAPVLDAGAPRSITRLDALILLCFMVLYLRYTMVSARKAPLAEQCAPVSSTQAASTPSAKSMGTAKAVVLVVAGLAALVYGGDRFVDGASDVARAIGISDAVIGLTIVAAGTSLPELATSAAAALKNKPGLAIGNVIGSNILNITLVLGVAAAIRPLPFGGVTTTDLLVQLGASLIFLLFGWIIGKRTITRGEGGVMIALFVAYTVWLVISV